MKVSLIFATASSVHLSSPYPKEDVYKRQQYARQTEKASVYRRTESGTQKAERPVYPVSYTHLDVYKRQEYANQNAYDCIQIHGGSGFMMEYACQRIYRDARITLSLIHL